MAHIVHSFVLHLPPPVVVVLVLRFPGFKCDKKMDCYYFFIKQNSKNSPGINALLRPVLIDVVNPATPCDPSPPVDEDEPLAHHPD